MHLESHALAQMEKFPAVVLGRVPRVALPAPRPAPRIRHAALGTLPGDRLVRGWGWRRCRGLFDLWCRRGNGVWLQRCATLLAEASPVPVGRAAAGTVLSNGLAALVAESRFAR